MDYALRLKKELGADRTWVVAYANEVPCYIPSERILKEGGYEAGWDADQGPGVPGATSNVLFYGWAAPLAAWGGGSGHCRGAFHAEEVKQSSAERVLGYEIKKQWSLGLRTTENSPPA